MVTGRVIPLLLKPEWISLNAMSLISRTGMPVSTRRGCGEAKVISQLRSPGPKSRVATTTTSPRHPRFAGSNLESPNKRVEEGHPLPLPPTSPTSPPTRVCNSPVDLPLCRKC